MFNYKMMKFSGMAWADQSPMVLVLKYQDISSWRGFWFQESLDWCNIKYQVAVPTIPYNVIESCQMRPMI